MADIDIKTQPVDRAALRLISDDPRVIKFFENLAKDVTQTLPDSSTEAADAAAAAQATADNAQASANTAQGTANGAQADASSALSQIGDLRTPQYVVLTASVELTNERVLTAGGNITITDGGAGNAVTLEVQANPVFVDSLGATQIEIGDGAIGLFGALPVARSAGWGAPTGTATKATFDTATVTTPQLAERVKALIDYLMQLGILA